MDRRRTMAFSVLALVAGGAAGAQAIEHPIGEPVIAGGMEVAAVFLQPIEMDPPGVMRDAAQGGDPYTVTGGALVEGLFRAADEHWVAITVEHEAAAERLRADGVPVKGLPWMMNGTVAAGRNAAPPLGGDNRAIAIDLLGRDPAKYEQLVAMGILADAPRAA